MRNENKNKKSLTTTFPQGIKKPNAPPVYKPPSPKVAQPKLAPVSRPQATPKTAQPKMNAVVNRKPPIAPPIYRPQPVPKVLQAKPSSSHGPYIGQARRRPIAASVCRSTATKIVQPSFTSKARAGQIIQRTPDESENLRNVGLRWNKIAEKDKGSQEKHEFFKTYASEIHQKLGFKVYTVWHKHDPYVGGGKNKNYVKIVKALQGHDEGKTAATQYIDWATNPGTSITTLSHDLKELIIIVHVAEVGRGFQYAPQQLFSFMEDVKAAASKDDRVRLWQNFKKRLAFALTAKEDDTDYVQSDDESSDESISDEIAI